jgi:16S rRNA (uracil1498-N3)-methyltransferase
MRRFFVPIKNIEGGKISILDKSQVHHIKDVLRLKVKDNLMIFDDRGNEYNCIIEKITNEVTLGIKGESLLSSKKEGIKITLACAIPKKSKMDDIIDKLTQLGVDRIIPLETERVVVKLNKNKKEARLLRWQKIALSAAQQSQRNTSPVIEPIKNIKEVLIKSENYDLKLIPTLTGKRKILKEVFTQIKPKNILVLIGPEGDFANGEIKLALENGFIPVTLGDTVLRVDTAAVAIVSYIKLSFT